MVRCRSAGAGERRGRRRIRTRTLARAEKRATIVAPTRTGSSQAHPADQPAERHSIVLSLLLLSLRLLTFACIYLRERGIACQGFCIF